MLTLNLNAPLVDEATGWTEAEWLEAMDAQEREQRFQQQHPRLAALLDKWYKLRWWLLWTFVCQRGRNCDVEMDGYADGDTGYEDWYCKRCGRGGRHIYY